MLGVWYVIYAIISMALSQISRIYRCSSLLAPIVRSIWPGCQDRHWRVDTTVQCPTKCVRHDSCYTAIGTKEWDYSVVLDIPWFHPHLVEQWTAVTNFDFCAHKFFCNPTISVVPTNLTFPGVRWDFERMNSISQILAAIFARHFHGTFWLPRRSFSNDPRDHLSLSTP